MTGPADLSERARAECFDLISEAEWALNLTKLQLDRARRHLVPYSAFPAGQMPTLSLVTAVRELALRQRELADVLGRVLDAPANGRPIPEWEWARDQHGDVLNVQVSERPPTGGLDQVSAEAPGSTAPVGGASNSGGTPDRAEPVPPEVLADRRLGTLPGITTVRDADGHLWERQTTGLWRNSGEPDTDLRWADLSADYGPLIWRPGDEPTGDR